MLEAHTHHDDSSTPLGEATSSEHTGKHINRRTVLKGVAWGAPAIAVATAVPFAAASVGNSSLAWTGSTLDVLNVRVLNDDSVATSSAGLTLPSEFTLTNGPGAISSTATVTVVVNRPSGVSLTAGRTYGFGVYSLGGVEVASGANTTAYESTLGIEYGFPVTTFTGSYAFVGDSGADIEVLIEFGLSGSHDLVSVGVAVTFPVSLTVAFPSGGIYTAQTSITVPLGAGLL